MYFLCIEILGQCLLLYNLGLYNVIILLGKTENATHNLTTDLEFQDIIRASVTREQNPTETKSGTPPMVIKLPTQTEETGPKIPLPPIPTKQTDHDTEEDEDDDWDAFQSFPASTNEVIPSLEVESTTQEPKYAIESKDVGQEAFEVENQMKEFHGSQDSGQLNEESSSQLNDSHEEKIQTSPSQENCQASSDVQSVEVAEGFSGPPDDHSDEKIGVGPSQENVQALSDVQSVEVAELFSDPPDDNSDEKIGARLSQENVEALSDLQSVEVAGGHTELLRYHNQEREITVTDSDNREVMSYFQSSERENTVTNRDSTECPSGSSPHESNKDREEQVEYAEHNERSSSSKENDIILGSSDRGKPEMDL